MKPCAIYRRKFACKRGPLLLAILFGSTSCAGPHSINSDSERKLTISEAFSPLGIGSSKKDVERALKATWTTALIMVHPGQLAPGGEGVLPNGVHLTVAFDDQDRVFRLASSDSRIRVASTLGVGSSVEQVTKSLPGACFKSLPGYGALIHAGGGAWLAFYPVVPIMSLTDKVSWIELRSDLNPTP